jgi:hypothetical protein
MRRRSTTAAGSASEVEVEVEIDRRLTAGPMPFRAARRPADTNVW